MDGQNTYPNNRRRSKRKVLFCDSVNFQLAEGFHEECRYRINTVVYLLPANHTDKVQPIDAGFGYMMKSKIGDAMERWLKVDHNLDHWHGKLPARERERNIDDKVGS